MDPKSNKALIAKLITALIILATALTGYIQVKTQTAEIERQNAMAYKALAEKVNAMAEKLAYLDGRVAGLSSKDAERGARVRVQRVSTEAPVVVSPSMAPPSPIAMEHVVVAEPEYAPLPKQLDELVQQKMAE